MIPQQPDPLDGLRTMVDQMIAAADAGLYFAALVLALTLPDICGALASENGQSTGRKATAWLGEWARQVPASPEAIWRLRCSLLHQGSASPRDGSARVAFMEPGAGIRIHGPGSLISAEGGEEVTFLDVATFAAEIGLAVRSWLAVEGTSPQVRRNAERFAHRRWGLPPYLAEGPVIA